jgi:hypothetical protein
MSHRLFSLITLAVAVQMLAGVGFLVAWMAGNWSAAPVVVIEGIEKVARILEATVLVMPGLAALLTTTRRGTSLRLGFLAAIPASAFLGLVFHGLDRSWLAPLSAAMGLPAIARLIAKGRRDGASAAIPGIAAVVVWILNLTSSYVFTEAAPAILASSIEAAGIAYGVDPTEYAAFRERATLAMEMSGSLSFLVPGIIWSFGALVLASLHERMASGVGRSRQLHTATGS